MKLLSDEEVASKAPDSLISAMVQAESSGDPNAVSDKGAGGLMQLMPATAREMGLSSKGRFDPAANLKAGTAYIERLAKHYGGDFEKALTAYNWGRGNVAKYGADAAPPETQQYVDKVFKGAGMKRSSWTDNTPTPGIDAESKIPATQPSEGLLAGLQSGAESFTRNLKGRVAHPLEALESTVDNLAHSNKGYTQEAKIREGSIGTEKLTEEEKTQALIDTALNVGGVGAIKEIKALVHLDPAMTAFGDTFQKLIKQKDVSMEDANRIGQSVIDTAKTDPHKMVPRADKLTVDSFLKMKDGKPYDPENVAHALEATDETKRIHALKKTNPEKLVGALKEEGEVISNKRAEDLKGLTHYLDNNQDYTKAEQSLIVSGASKWAMRYDKEKDAVSLVEIAPNNRHNVTVVDSEMAPAIAQRLRAGEPLKDAFKNGSLDAIHRSMEKNEATQATGWKIYKKSNSMEDAAELSKGTSGTTWCTFTGGTNTAHSQLKDGDFHVYYKDGVPEIAIRTTDGKLAEPVRGNTKNQDIKEWHGDVALDYLKKSTLTGWEDLVADKRDKELIKQSLSSGELHSELVAQMLHYEAGRLEYIPLKRRVSGYSENSAYEPSIANALKNLTKDTTLKGLLEKGMLPSGNYGKLDTAVIAKYANNVTTTGNVALREGTKLKLPQVTTTGTLYLRDGATLNLPQVTTTGALHLREGTKLKLPQVTTTTGALYLHERVKLKLPQVTTTGNLHLREGATLDLPQVTTIGSVDLREGATLNLPQVTTIGDVVLSERATLDLQEVTTTGALYLHERAKLKLPQVTTTGNVVLRDGATLDLPQVTTIGNVDLREGTTLDLQEVTTIGNVDLREGTKLNLPQGTTTGNLYLYEDTTLDLQKVTTTGNVVLREGATLNLPQVTTIGNVELREGTKLNLPESAKTGEVRGGGLLIRTAAGVAGAIAAGAAAAEENGDKKMKLLSDEEVMAEDHGPTEDYAAPRSSVEKWASGGVDAARQIGSGMLAGAASLGAEVSRLAARHSPIPLRAALTKIAPGYMSKDAEAAGKEASAKLNIPAETKEGKAIMASMADFMEPVTSLIESGKSSVAEALGDSPDARAAADIVSNVVLAGLPKVVQVGSTGAKYLMRGGAAAGKKMEANLATFKKAGVDRPTIGQVSEGGLTKASGAHEDVIARQVPQIQSRIAALASKLSSVGSLEEAGRMVTSAIEGTPEMETYTSKRGNSTMQRPTGKTEGGWLQDVKDRESELHQKWQKAVGNTQPVPMSTTLTVLDDLTRVNPGAASTTSSLLNPKLMDLRARVFDDAQGKLKTLPLDAVEDLRKKIGELTDPSIGATLTAQQANSLYAALKTDVVGVVKSKGIRAVRAYDKAFEFSRDMHDVAESIMNPILKSKTVEASIKAVMNGTQDGASQMRTLFRGKGGVKGLNPVEQDAIRAIVLKELGKGVTHEFSAADFLKNWGKLHSDTKNVLFGKGSQLQNTLDALAKVAKTHEGSGTTYYTFKNYALSHGGEGALGLTALLLHGVPAAAIVLAPAGMGFITGRMMSNPAFVKWLAAAAKNRSLSPTTALANLSQRAAQAPDDVKEDISKYIEGVKSLTVQDIIQKKEAAGNLVPGITPNEVAENSAMGGK